MLLSQKSGFLRQKVSIEAGVHPERLGLAPDGAHRVLMVEELHVGGGEGEQVRPQGDKPHVQRDAEQRDREEDAQEAESAQSQRALRKQQLQMESYQKNVHHLGRCAPRSPSHFIQLKLVHEFHPLSCDELMMLSSLSPHSSK